MTFFGSLTAAVPFLLDLFRIPADTFQLFLATGVINSRVGSLVAAMHTLTVALLVSCAVTGHLRWRRGPFLSYAGITAALVIVVLGGTRVLFATGLSREYSKDKVLASMHLLHEPVAATVARTSSPAPVTTLPPLEAIDERKVLRVGYLPDALPFAFFNQAGDLVGFDVELAHRLAREMGVTLAFVPVDRDRLRGAARGGLLRPRDVGRGRDDGPGERRALLGFVSGRNPRVRRTGRPARALRELGRHPRPRRA